jgi:hypothetical protein
VTVLPPIPDATAWPWVVLLLLGAAHGLNPGMGWLFAVALGVQRGERRAVWRALLPLGAGHALAVAAAVALAAVAGLVVPLAWLRWGVAALLLAVGVLHWTRHLHPARGGMRVGARDLAAWSFLMATAHGAGLMALPFAMDAGAVREPAAHAAHAAHAAVAPATAGAESAALLATLVHAAGYLLVTGLVAVVVYERVGLRFLRRGWFNVDRLWAGALVVTAVAIVVV